MGCPRRRALAAAGRRAGDGLGHAGGYPEGARTFRPGDFRGSVVRAAARPFRCQVVVVLAQEVGPPGNSGLARPTGGMASAVNWHLDVLPRRAARPVGRSPAPGLCRFCPLRRNGHRTQVRTPQVGGLQFLLQPDVCVLGIQGTQRFGRGDSPGRRKHAHRAASASVILRSLSRLSWLSNLPVSRQASTQRIASEDWCAIDTGE